MGGVAGAEQGVGGVERPCGLAGETAGGGRKSGGEGAVGESGRTAGGSWREAGLTGEGWLLGVSVGGAGVYTDANGNVYDGEWRDGIQRGRGAGKKSSYFSRFLYQSS